MSRRFWWWSCVFGVGVATAAEPPKRPEVVASVTSPDKVLRVEVGLDEGRASYTIKRFGETLIAPSRLGFLLRGAEKLERNLVLAAQSGSSHDETWEQPWGESRLVRNHYNELRVTLTETLKAKRSFEVIFRVFDDGVGFRYVFPEQPQLREVIIDDELTEFHVAPEATAWWIPAGEWNRYEYLYNRTPLTEVGQAHTPMTIRTRDGVHIAFHEAALIDYAAMWLRRVEGQRFKAQLSPASEGWKVRRAAPFSTPWRTLRIADSAAALYASNLELNLNEPNRLGDVSWFRPAKYVGVWWELHLERSSWARGAKHGATTANTRRYIDFAAEHGFRGVLVEGWNHGWDGNWFGDGNDFDFTRATEDFDLPALAAYAKSRGVHLVGHHETGGAVSHYERQLGAALDLYAKHGVDVIKTGYVADAGQIERFDRQGGPALREWHDGQWQSRHHLRVVTEAAKRHIAINPHEPIKDTGLRRTYPNWVSREGARGMEYAAWGNPQNPPEHEVNLVFTRMLAGPMDYTPGIVSLQGRTHPIPSTLAKQLALYVVIYSPIQMVADLPEHYAEHTDAFQFIQDVAVDWAETRVLNGEIGDYVTIARKDRNSETWFLGSLSDEHGRVLQVPLSFLTPGKTYRAEIYRDGDDAHYRDHRFAFATEQRDVQSSDMLILRIAPGGGQAIRFVAR
ncbi:MAG: glycoside hydrolase family 97 protein [Xanthomonadales bacterium]|nr:glycoside hydrolase family 97 protein [Xanthomonadales bacterium]